MWNIRLEWKTSCQCTSPSCSSGVYGNCCELTNCQGNIDWRCNFDQSPQCRRITSSRSNCGYLFIDKWNKNVPSIKRASCRHRRYNTRFNAIIFKAYKRIRRSSIKIQNDLKRQHKIKRTTLAIQIISTTIRQHI